jgi:periplasmic copper chaperone A
MRSMRAALVAASAAALAALGVSGCSAAGTSSSIAIASAYVAQPNAAGDTVGYLVIRNNGVADELLGVHDSAGGTVTLRGPVNTSTQPIVMRTVPSITVPAHATTQLIPNSYHLLITGARPMQAGKDITLRLTFAHAGTVTILALVTNPETGGGSYFLG